MVWLELFGKGGARYLASGESCVRKGTGYAWALVIDRRAVGGGSYRVTVQATGVPCLPLRIDASV